MDKKLLEHYHLDNAIGFAERLLALTRTGRGLGHADEFMLDYAADAVLGLQAARGGHVYVATNPMFPKLVKIGQTRLAPEARMASLSAAGSPTAFVLAGSAWYPDRCWAEAEIHRRLAPFWAAKEFYAMQFDRAVREVQYLAATERAAFERSAGAGTCQHSSDRP
jgi:hypothetical protein